MTAPIQQRCFNHVQREAAARCPECGRCFCRECVTEHEGRVVCAVCLQRVARTAVSARARFGIAGRTLQFLAGVFVAWLFFYLIGAVLVALPDSFHEGTLWTRPWTAGASGPE